MSISRSDRPAHRGKIAIYPGTFDPITMGHLDIVERASEIFDKVIIAIARNPAKTTLFTIEERLQMIQECFSEDNKKVEVVAIQGLVVDYASTVGAKVLVKGLRALSDFDYEFQLALMNRRMVRDVETVFLMTGLRWIYISSSIVKDVASHGGDVQGLVPDLVGDRLRAHYSKQ
ncbi:MAG: pantetheine-phosphate adenylyltransferase [Desulfobulbaceae bacterium]|uniref:Phosphopantetheine adenylyltransferase n=1 Tax=Candidatus Desulfobia pelagia TaxID=2841692 RepID=A0A8J6NDS0_9BACT|nr:pantetheine-phosphate adenylyltransferase [Candidatus Desulfobia pelagia]